MNELPQVRPILFVQAGNVGSVNVGEIGSRHAVAAAFAQASVARLGRRGNYAMLSRGIDDHTEPTAMLVRSAKMKAGPNRLAMRSKGLSAPPGNGARDVPCRACPRRARSRRQERSGPR